MSVDRVIIFGYTLECMWEHEQGSPSEGSAARFDSIVYYGSVRTTIVESFICHLNGCDGTFLMVFREWK